MSKIRSNEPTHCFSIVFPDTDTEYDEDRLATETVEHIGGVMHRIKISQSQIVDNLADAVYHSEGLAVNGHLSCKYLLNQEIRKEGFKVALTGEGADECLAGYPHLRKDIIANLSNIFEPFMPETCEKIRKYLKLSKCKWSRIELNSNIQLENIEPLFTRIENI